MRIRQKRLVAVIAGLAVVIPCGVAALVWARFDPQTLRPALEQQVRHLTGCEVQIAGLDMQFLPRPAVVVRDIQLVNPRSGGVPMQGSIQRLSADVAFWPLLRHVVRIDTLRVDALNLAVAKGSAEPPLPLVMRPAPSEAALPNAVPSEMPSAAPDEFSLARAVSAQVQVRRLILRNAQLSWYGRSSALQTIHVPQADIQLPQPGRRASVQAKWELDGLSGTLRGETEKWSVLPVHGAMLPWPLRLELSAHRTTDLQDGPILEQAVISLTGMDQPVQIDARGQWRGMSVDLQGQLASAQTALEGAAWPVALDGHVGAGKFSIKGQVAHPASLTGIGLAVETQIDDLGTVWPLWGGPLPSLRDITLRTQLSDDDQGLGQRVVLRGMSLASPFAQMVGDLSIQRGPKPDVQGAVAAHYLDLDALRPLIMALKPNAAVPVATQEPQIPPSTAKARAGHVASDASLPFPDMRGKRADLQFGVEEMVWHKARYQGLTGHIRLAEGVARIDPLAVRTPAGVMSGSVQLAQDTAIPRVELVVQAPSLLLPALMDWLNWPVATAGALGLDAHLKGAGQSLHELLAQLDGHLGIFTTNAQINAMVLNAVLAPLMQAAHLPSFGGLGQNVALSCLAVRLDVAHGQGVLPILQLQTPQLHLTGGGTIDFAAEVLALRLHPLVSMGGISVTMPVDVEGPWRDPRLRVGVSHGGGVPSGLSGVHVPGMGGRLGHLLGNTGDMPEKSSSCPVQAVGAP